MGSLAIKQTAYGLVELMLGLFLGSCLVGLLLRHYLIVKQHEKETSRVLAQTYDQLLMNELIRSSIKHAGFTPCSSLQRLITQGDDPKQSLEAITLNVGNKKALQIARMSEDFTVVQSVQSSQQLLVESDVDFKVNERILLADCFHAEVKTIESIKREGATWRIHLNNRLRYSYDPPMYIGEWLQEQFYIDRNKTGHTALYYQTNHSEELSDQIQSMTVQLVNDGKKKQLLNIDFISAHEKTWRIVTAVRSG